MPFWTCFSCLKLNNDESVAILDYSNGTLTDVPPNVSQFERTLEELYLSSNRISDLPPELFYCQGLRILKLNDNELVTIPDAIGSLRQLEVLDLSRNALTYIPDNIKSCKHLTHLDLSLNNLQRLPDAITSLISLKELFLNETYLEFLPANFGRLVNLKILELRSNNLITLPKSMARLTNLVRIDIGANEFTELPEVIGQLTQLKELWIDYNRIRRISANISNLGELVHFEANSNQLTLLPGEISHWRNLEVLSLSSNDLDSLPFSIGMLKRLKTLKCDSNQLKEIPDSVCYLESLEEMVVDHNCLMRLPNTIGLLRKLRFLAADENLIRRLPSEICSCTGLTVLSLRNNKLVELPSDIGHLINLEVLNIVNNAISYLPVSILNLTRLKAMWISDNQSQPLVQFHYLNNMTKSELTCFMLPQTNSIVEQQQQQKQSIECTNIATIQGGIATWNKLLQQQRKTNGNCSPNQQNSSLLNSSPSRKICFADEFGGKNEIIPKRLMRSPTPYPKELRLMAKYIKNVNNSNSSSTENYQLDNVEMISLQTTEPNNGQVSYDQEDLQESFRIKEAKVLSNTGGIQNNQFMMPKQNFCNIGVQHTDLMVADSASTISNCDTYKHVKNENEMNLNAENDYSCNQNKVARNGRNFYLNLNASYQNDENLVNEQQSCILYNTQSDNLVSNSIVDTGNNMYVVSTVRTTENDHNQQNHMYVYEMRQNSEGSKQTQQQYQGEFSLRNSLAESQTALENQFHHHQQQQPHEYGNLRQPPPYYIAKAYTKKSREDLLNYDSIRNRSEDMKDDKEYCGEGIVNGTQASEYENELNMNSDVKNVTDNNYNQRILKYHQGLNDVNLNNNNSKVIEHLNCHVNGYEDSSKNFVTNSNIITTANNSDYQSRSSSSTNDIQQATEMNHHSYHFHQQQSENSNSDPSDNMTMYSSDCVDGETKEKNQSPSSSSLSQFVNYSDSKLHLSKPSSQWLFGLHKNPTVKQFVFKKDPILGFDIKEIQNQGIFVSIIIPNTTAAQLLRVNDKILDVDGINFEKISLQEAKQVLMDSEPFLYIMISRK